MFVVVVVAVVVVVDDVGEDMAKNVVGGKDRVK